MNNLIRCNCGVPIAKRIDSRKIEVLKYHLGQPLAVRLEYNGDKCTIICGKCGNRVELGTSKIALSMTYVIAEKK